MKLITVLSLSCALTMPMASWANESIAATPACDFAKSFSDSTLRLDYIVGGLPGDIDIQLSRAYKSDGWFGRKANMSKPMYDGYVSVAVTSMLGDTLYANSASSLFCEWLDQNEATPKAFECTMLVPYPRDSVMISVSVLDKWHKPMRTAKHIVDPADILIAELPQTSYPHYFVREGSYEGQKIGVAFLSEGYTAEEMDIYRSDVSDAVDALLSHEPFGEYKERFDFIAVEVPSVDSGASVPKNGEWKNTPFKSHFSTFYSDRYLTSPEVFAMYDALNGIPAQHIIVLVNTEVYGGGGIFNDYTLTAAHHKSFKPVVVHEFGHSFGGLTDEYFYEGDHTTDTYPLDVEPWEPNITTLVDFNGKWENLIPEGTPFPVAPADAEKYPVGLYEGGGYSSRGIYRPVDWCRMRTNNVEGFCPACQKALKEIILFYTE